MEVIGDFKTPVVVSKAVVKVKSIFVISVMI